MRASNVTVALATASLLLSSVGGSSVALAQSHSAIDRKAPEAFAYAPATDRNVSVTVGAVALAGDKAFLPKDKNWIQIELIVANLSPRVVHFSDVKTKLSNGVVVAGAKTVLDLAQPPSMGGSMVKTAGIGTVGTIAGAMIFPPLALVGGIGALFASSKGVGSWKKRMERINATALNPQDIAPGTSVSGYVFMPAIQGQTALIVFYAIDGKPESLTVSRLAR